MARRRRRKHEVIFLVAAAILIAFLWGAFEVIDPVEVDDNGDIDNDKMDDEWEMQYFSNLDQTADGDFDGDGLTNLQEHTDGTDPTIPKFIPPVELDFTSFVRNYDSNNTYTVTVSVNGTELYNGTVNPGNDTDPQILGSPKLTLFNGTYVFNITAFDGIENRTANLTLELEKKFNPSKNATEVPKLYFDIRADAIIGFFSTSGANEAVFE